MLEEIDIQVIKNTLPKIQRGVEKYVIIMDNFRTRDVSKDREFQRTYNGFYKIRQRTQDFYRAYFEYMEKHKFSQVSFEGILTYLYNSTSRVESSFSSKMLATINPDMPIWDINVLSQLSIKHPSLG